MSEIAIIRDTLAGYVAGLAARPLTRQMLHEIAHGCVDHWMRGYWQGETHRINAAVQNPVAARALVRALLESEAAR